jgi:uncharacterized protein YkwD
VTRRKRIAGLTALIVVGVAVLAGCRPAPAPAPAPPPPPPTVSCNGASTYVAAIEQCLQQVNPYWVDPTAEAVAQNNVNRYAGATCSSGVLQHVGVPAGYGENLYCKFYGGPTCPSPQQFANDAVNAWLASPAHQANMTNFVGGGIGAGYTCTNGSAFGAVEFHH